MSKLGHLKSISSSSLFSLSSSSTSNSKTMKWTAFLIVTSILFNLIYQPLPDGFHQPWKYRLICFGSDLAAYYGRFLEYTGLGHRVNVTRMAYHLAVGAFNIRDHQDSINITDQFVQDVPIRIYFPNSRKSSHQIPTILFYHGGGYFVGSADTLEPVTYLLAKYTNFQVIYIEYRLIPEHKYPAALTDSLSATTDLISNHQEYKIDLNNLILMGDSAGGNLATVVSQKLIERKLAQPKLQVLVYPILQFFDFTLPSYRKYLPKRVLGNIGHENFKNFIHYFTGIEVDDSIFSNGHTNQMHKESDLSEYVNPNYLPHEFRRDHDFDRLEFANDSYNKYSDLSKILLSSDVSPLLVSDEYLRVNTPANTILLTTEIDILRDDGFIYAERLRRLNLNIHHTHHETLFHGIFGLLHGLIKFDVAHSLVKDVAERIVHIVAK